MFLHFISPKIVLSSLISNECSVLLHYLMSNYIKMKKIIILSMGILLSILACNSDKPTDYARISGKIENKNGDELQIRNHDNQVIKKIKVNKDGTFTDTLKVSKGRYAISDGKEYASLYLRPGDDITMNLDAVQFDETLSFKGKGSAESNYMVKKLLKQEQVFENINNLYTKPKDEFLTELKNLKSDFNSFLKEQKGLDPDFIQKDITDTENLFSYLEHRYDKMAKINSLIGKPAPQFTNYENFNGGTTSLSDLKGKYTYIDVWATWCRPCLGEIPSLKKLEKELGDKINFVSISIDKKDKHEAWKQMVATKELKGYQLFADHNWDSKFVQDFGIDGIPRFILIDPEGNVLKPDAPRPSNPKTKELLTSLIQ